MKAEMKAKGREDDFAGLKVSLVLIEATRAQTNFFLRLSIIP
jgi:hypothetical protein